MADISELNDVNCTRQRLPLLIVEILAVLRWSRRRPFIDYCHEATAVRRAVKRHLERSFETTDALFTSASLLRRLITAMLLLLLARVVLAQMHLLPQQLITEAALRRENVRCGNDTFKDFCRLS